jgi:hypothetical protein
MKMLKQLAVLCALSIPVSAFAVGTSSGTITHLYADNAYGDLIYVEASGVKTGNPACDTGKAPYQFVLQRTTQLYADLLTFLVWAKEANQTVTLVGSGTCGVDFTVESLVAVTW